MKTIFYVVFIAVILLLYVPWYKKFQGKKHQEFFEKVKHDDMIRFTTNFFCNNSFIAEEEIKDTFIKGQYVVQVLLCGNRNLLLNCYYSGKYELVYGKSTINIADLTTESLQEGIKKLNVDTQQLTHC